MNLERFDKCTTCPDRVTVSCLAARLLLGKNYQPEDCEGRVVLRKDNEQFSSADRMIGDIITPVTYGCGKPNENGEPKPDLATFNWDNGDRVSTINHETQA